MAKKKKSIGTTNRTKGHNAERFYAKVFKNLGFQHCVTSRYGSRIHDDAGIDLIHLPINVQIKAGKQTGMIISKVLSYVTERVKQLFPETSPEQNYPTILIHRKDVGRGKKRNEFDDIVSMSFKDFEKLIKKIKWE